MNVDKVQEIGIALKVQVVAVDRIRTAVDRLIGDARRNWSGRDLNAFAESWTGQHRTQLSSLRESIEHLANAALRNADEQERASGSDYPHGPDFVADGLSREIAQQWQTMGEKEQRLVLQLFADHEADRYGLPHVLITFADLKDGEKSNSYGSWNEAAKMMVIDSTDVDHSRALATIAHEMRHAAQHAAIGDTPIDTDGWGAVERGEVEKWRANLADGKYISPDKDGYESQPVEVDARQAAEAALRALSQEDFDRLRQQAGIQLTPQVGSDGSLA